jgi:hypothetical protein
MYGEGIEPNVLQICTSTLTTLNSRAAWGPSMQLDAVPAGLKNREKSFLHRFFYFHRHMAFVTFALSFISQLYFP